LVTSSILEKVATLKDVYDRARAVEQEVLAPVRQTQSRLAEFVEQAELALEGGEQSLIKQERAGEMPMVGEAGRVARMAEARRSLLAPTLELQDGVKRYMAVLADDGGRSARMSRSSHRDLFMKPAKVIDDGCGSFATA
jgi:hypothetical protein